MLSRQTWEWGQSYLLTLGKKVNKRIPQMSHFFFNMYCVVIVSFKKYMKKSAVLDYFMTFVHLVSLIHLPNFAV